MGQDGALHFCQVAQTLGVAFFFFFFASTSSQRKQVLENNAIPSLKMSDSSWLACWTHFQREVLEFDFL